MQIMHEMSTAIRMGRLTQQQHSIHGMWFVQVAQIIKIMQVGGIHNAQGMHNRIRTDNIQMFYTFYV